MRDGFQENVGDSFDWPLFITAALIGVVGVVNLRAATSVYTAGRADLWVNQIVWMVSGGALGVFLGAIDYRHVERWAYFAYGGGVLSLVLVLALGRDVRGSARWINLGPFAYQPSEFMKVCLIIALGKFFQDGQYRSEAPRQLKELAIPAALAAVPVFLVLRQPDLGTALILSLIFVAIASLLRIRWQSLALLVFVFAVAAPLIWEYGLHDYQRARVTSFLSPDADVRGSGWHAHNARIAIGNGGLFGQGYMRGSQNQYLFLPDQYSDFPFPVFAEDWGFAGGVIVLGLYAFLVLWSVRIASQAKDRFGAVVAVGVGAMIFWHAVFNLGMVTGVLPVVGVTLPLFSYGGSSVMTILIGLGLLMNVSMRRPNMTPVRSGQILLAR